MALGSELMVGGTCLVMGNTVTWKHLLGKCFFLAEDLVTVFSPFLAVMGCNRPTFVRAQINFISAHSPPHFYY